VIRLLQTLRAATSPLHRELDGMLAEGMPTRSREAYAGYLVRFRDGVGRCWPELDWSRLEKLGLPDAPMRQARYHALGGDLLALGQSQPPLADATRPAAPARMIGILYVLEGSIHGGMALLGDLRRHDPEAAGIAGRFLSGFGERNRSSWADFVAWLESIPTGGDLLPASADGAACAFRHFLNAFSPRVNADP
jgi:heme oxygenase